MRRVLSGGFEDLFVSDGASSSIWQATIVAIRLWVSSEADYEYPLDKFLYQKGVWG